MIFALLLALQAPVQVQNARVAGQVLSQAGGPLKKASIRLQAMMQPGQPTTPTSYTAASDAEGRFLFEDVSPGKYYLSAQRTGYINQQYGAKSSGTAGTPLSLDAGQEMKDLVFKLIPQAMIFGRVVDEDGDPLPNYSIQASRWTFVNGKKQLQVAGNSSSQADGTFVMGSLRAGRYYLSADSRANNFTMGLEKPGSRKPQESYLKTYYPNALDAASAALIDVAEGAEVRGAEIHVRRGRVYTVQGRIDSGSNAPRYAQLMLLPKNNVNISFPDQRQAQVQGKEGLFVFKNVPPGVYILQSQFTEAVVKDPTGEFSKSVPLVARLEVTVADQDIEGLVVPLVPGPAIKGSFKTEGVDPASQAPGAKALPSVQLRATGATIGGSAGYSEVNEDGTFRMQGVVPGVVRVSVFNLPENTYIKAINFGGQDVNGKDLDLSNSSGGEIQVIVSPNGAEVTGTVRDADGKAMPSAVVQICDKSGEVAKSANTDQNGAFDLKGLAPGEYKVFAWEDRGDGIIQDPDFRKIFESKATVVKLVEKSHENVEPGMIAKAAMDVEAAKVQ
ncbi:MAG TPA: carboxypeptidase-like regulatory domain-containing protein [Bryobacteraceae bacterium]|nr:carboxypeptidase-like regulatory domain-containing protein [Bryobacteraceae bacterium]